LNRSNCDCISFQDDELRNPLHYSIINYFDQGRSNDSKWIFEQILKESNLERDVLNCKDIFSHSPLFYYLTILEDKQIEDDYFFGLFKKKFEGIKLKRKIDLSEFKNCSFFNKICNKNYEEEEEEKEEKEEEEEVDDDFEYDFVDDDESSRSDD